MSKEDVLLSTGRVIELLPNALFKIELDAGTTILGHLAGKLRINNINLLLGDTVDIELSAYDMSKGRIIFRHKRPR